MSERISDTNTDQMLQALTKEIVKVYRVYDGSDRLITQYEALANTLNGEPCVKTTYTYIGATTKLEKMKEAQDTWSSAYDI